MAIVLLRGLVREAGHWGDFPSLLSGRLGGAEVVTPDLPGNGRRRERRSPLSVAEMVEAARGDVGAGPHVVFAVSLGGMVAIEWASRWPQDLDGVIVVNSSLGGLSPFFRRLRPSAWPTVFGALGARDVDARERRILALVANAPPPGRGDDWVAIQRQRPVKRGDALRQLVAATRYRVPAEPPRVPALVLVGDGDRLVSPSCSRAIAGWLNAPLAAHPTAGHDITTDDGPWVADRVAEWLATLAMRRHGENN